MKRVGAALITAAAMLIAGCGDDTPQSAKTVSVSQPAAQLAKSNRRSVCFTPDNYRRVCDNEAAAYCHLTEGTRRLRLKLSRQANDRQDVRRIQQRIRQCRALGA